MATEVTDNSGRSRYELQVDGQTVFAIYHRDGAILTIQHVEAPPALRGTGAASRLMQGVVDTARAAGWKLRPLCSYAAWWMSRHPEHGDLMS